MTTAIKTKARKTKPVAGGATPANSWRPPHLDMDQPGAIAPGSTYLPVGRVAIELIHPHPDNPRKRFDEAGLATLAESIRRNDVLQPLVVRLLSTGGETTKDKHGRPHYQLICGERRWRAAMAAGLTTIPVTVRELSDAEALELMIVENEERADLNPIELAIGLAALCKPIEAGGAGLTQAEAALRFSHEEAWAGNLMRLLHLPTTWQERVASGELPHTFARSLVPYAKCQVVLDWAEDELQRRGGADELRREDFEHLLDLAVKEATRPIDDSDKPFYDYRLSKSGHYGRLFKLTAEIEPQLNITELPVASWGRGPKRERTVVRRATNVALWDRLNEEAKAERFEKSAKRAAKSAKGGNGKAPTAAELAAKRDQQDSLLERRAGDWAEDLLRHALARELKLGQHDWVCRLFVRYWIREAHGYGAHDPAGVQEDVLAAAGCVYKNEPWLSLLEFVKPDDDPIGNQDNLDRVEATWILKPTVERRYSVDRGVVYSLASLVGVSFQEEWRCASGDRLRDFFNAHTMDQLLDLAKELGEHVANMKKGDLVNLMAESHQARPYKLPSVLSAAAPKVRGRKPR